MLSAAFTVLGFISKILGLPELAARFFELAQARRQGMADQKLANDEATIAAATEASRIGSDIAGKSDADVIKDLDKDFRP